MMMISDDRPLKDDVAEFVAAQIAIIEAQSTIQLGEDDDE